MLLLWEVDILLSLPRVGLLGSGGDFHGGSHKAKSDGNWIAM